jgi:hypothetical protein
MAENLRHAHEGNAGCDEASAQITPQIVATKPFDAGDRKSVV